MAAYTLTLRHGSRVEHIRFDELEPALSALEGRIGELAGAERRETVDLRYRRIEPAAQVAARAEIAGRRLRGGVDLRGDGAVEAFTGRLRRRLVKQRNGETPYQALRRALRASTAR